MAIVVESRMNFGPFSRDHRSLSMILAYFIDDTHIFQGQRTSIKISQVPESKDQQQDEKTCKENMQRYNKY
jgi:hypothetical protein